MCSMKYVAGTWQTKDCINLKKLLETVNYPTFDVDDFLTHHINDLLLRVNTTLRIVFIERFEIGQENDQYDIFIKDDDMHLRECDGLHAVFNEAKINLVVILILLHAVLMLQASRQMESINCWC